MNDDIMNAVNSLLNPISKEDMWKKFFDEVEFSDSFNEGISAYLSLGEDISDYESDLEIIASDWYEAKTSVDHSIREIDNNIKEIDNSIGKIDEVLGEFRFTDEEKIALENKKNELETQKVELNKLRKSKMGEYFKNLSFTTAKDEKVKWIAQRVEAQAEWKEKLRNEFEVSGGLKSVIMNQIENERGQSEALLKQYNNQLTNIQSNLKYYDEKYKETKRMYGDFHDNTKTFFEALQNSMAQSQKVSNQINSLKSNIAKMNTMLIQYEKFVRNMTFDDFWEKLLENRLNQVKKVVTNPGTGSGNSDTDFEDAMKNQEEMYHKDPIKVQFGETSQREKEAQEEFDKLFDSKTSDGGNGFNMPTTDKIYLDALDEAKKRQAEVREAVNDYDLNSKSSLDTEEEWKKAYEEEANKNKTLITLEPEFDNGMYTNDASKRFEKDIESMRRRWSGDFDYDSYYKVKKEAKSGYKDGRISKDEMKSQIKQAKEEFLSSVSDEEYLAYRDTLSGEYNENAKKEYSADTKIDSRDTIDKINSDVEYNLKFQANDKSKKERLVNYVRNNKKVLMNSFLSAIYKKFGYVEEIMNDEQYYEQSAKNGRSH